MKLRDKNALHFFLIAAAFIVMFTPDIVGCATATTPAVPLAPGYINSADQTMGQILSGARGFYSTVQCETQGLNWSQATNLCVADPNITTPLVLSTTTKAVFNDFGVSLNATNQVYLAYHAGTATQAAAQAAVTALQAKQNALPVVSGVIQ